MYVFFDPQQLTFTLVSMRSFGLLSYTLSHACTKWQYNTRWDFMFSFDRKHRFNCSFVIDSRCMYEHGHSIVSSLNTSRRFMKWSCLLPVRRSTLMLWWTYLIQRRSGSSQFLPFQDCLTNTKVCSCVTVYILFQASAVPRALYMCQWQLHQRPYHTG